jgi:Bacterial extracellular solute-binding protein
MKTLRKAIGPLATILLVAGIGLAINRSMHDKKLENAAAERTNVRVLTGSEKEKFLTDPELAKVLAGEGITITVEKAGSREIATRADLKSFDAAFPAGAHAAVKIAQLTGSKRSFAPFYTPMAVATWKELIPVLEKSGLVTQKEGAYFIIDMPKLVGMMEKGTRWKDLPGNTVYPVGKSILMSSTDVRKSNSGGMYLALAAYIANGNNVVDNDADAAKVADRMVGLFSRQGFQESSSAGPFEDYTAMGIGKAPLVMIYEQQFLEHIFAHQHPNPNMVLLYPAPTILSKHTIVALSDNGARFAQIINTNPKVISIAQRYGFRAQDNTELFALAEAKKLSIPHTVVDVIDPPSYDILEKLITHIDEAFKK